MLENKVALVTGAGRGIGRQIALTLAKEGATVVVNYNGSRERAEGVVAEIENAGGKAEAYGCDVSDFEACQEMINNVINKYGHLDILVNNAGIIRDSLIMKMKEEDFDCLLYTSKALKEYARLYGPLTIDTANDTCSRRWEWVMQPWPWEGGC